ncbi:hypothetical protein PIB30_113408, partial [Stylosanthes scabra]|nr:hypothetical protein [Stylosanthes scabra]
MVWSSSIYRHYSGLDAYALLVLCVYISSVMHAAQVWWPCTHRASGAYAPMLEGACAPLLQCVRMGVSFDLQAFLHDLFDPRALFSHFRSDLSLLKPETLEQTNQGIEQNGKH